MGSSSSSLNKSPFRADSMVTPESPTKDNNSAPMTVKPEKNDGVSIISDLLQTSSSAKKSFESPRKSRSSPANNNLTPVKSRWSFSSSKKSFGSKDETFFDSQQWLQSDSDDDFHSVNGDFTPSRGNTPKSSFSDRTPRIHNLIFQEKKPPRGSSSPAPQPRRKKLGELFRDSIREEREESSGSSSALSSPYLSGANSGEFNNATIEDSSVKEEKKKSNWQHHRCLPGFSSCGGSFMERRKKMSSETAVVAVK
ncbi:hypothetical protein EUTSA_v10004813mg [Eutrema salsugineum]|uniref:Uncharacterized protein n=1 Tax=Eutrema salsugineum TaxID=72664 RepID=V4KZ76_EUTSA|nr:uncharacterized protein At3g27210 [Eutrema salsugineum]ESQ32758.1 hypothetical protein EUTSA_v10004813mg [Eutrema salsugineum]